MENGASNGLFGKYQTPGMLAAIVGAYIAAFAGTSDRYTGNQAQHLTERVRQMELKMAALPSRFPPQVVVDALTKLEVAEAQLDDRMDALERKLLMMTNGK